jgi:hypothetical protein
MSRKAIIIAALAASLLGTAVSGFAATTLNFQVSVTVRLYAINIFSDGAANQLAWGALSPSITAVSAGGNTFAVAATPVYQVTNSGGSAIDLSLRQTAPAGWNMLTVAVAPGTTRTAAQYRLFAGFTGYLKKPVVADFAANDLVIGTNTIATTGAGAVYALAGEGTDGYTGGWNVVPETFGGPDQYKGTRAIMLCLDTPVIPPDENPRNLDITVTATVH